MMVEIMAVVMVAVPGVEEGVRTVVAMTVVKAMVGSMTVVTVSKIFTITHFSSSLYNI